MTEEHYSHLALSYFTGIGPVRFKTLMTALGSAEAILKARADELKPTLGANLARELITYRNKFNPAEKLDELKEKKITYLPSCDPKFPYQLKNISDPPIGLFVKGDIDVYNFKKLSMVAVVGTRKASTYGMHVASLFTSSLAAAGCVIVSGMARGIDSAAHRAALDMEGRTIAFLGCGVDIIYPYENAKLYYDILSQGGLIISEFPPGMTVRKGMFVARNRLISGISKNVLVVEGAEDSGALITARDAIHQGKDVYVSSIDITSQLAEAPMLLHNEGAKIVMSAEEILLDMSMQSVYAVRDMKSLNLAGDEKIIYKLLQRSPLTVDDIVNRSGLGIGQVFDLITGLELRSVIRKGSDGKYFIY